MNVRGVLTVFVLLAAPCLLATAQRDGPTDREYEVLSAFCLRQFNLHNLACMMDDSTWVAPLDASLLAKIGRGSSLAEDYTRKNRAPAPLDPERVLKAVRWEQGGQRFSRVGLSARGDSALVQMLAGIHKVSYVLVRRRGHWVMAHTHTVMSDEPIF